MTKICDFGKEIKKKLVDINQSQECLIQEVKKKPDFILTVVVILQ